MASFICKDGVSGLPTLVGAGRISIASGGVLGIGDQTLTSGVPQSLLGSPGVAVQHGATLALILDTINNAGQVLDFSDGSSSLPPTLGFSDTFSQGTVIAGRSLLPVFDVFSSLTMLGTLDMSGTDTRLLLDTVSFQPSGGAPAAILANGSAATLFLAGSIAADNVDILVCNSTSASTLSGTSAAVTISVHGTLPESGTNVSGGVLIGSIENMGTIMGAGVSGTTVSLFVVEATTLTNDPGGIVVGHKNGVFGVVAASFANTGTVSADSNSFVDVIANSMTNTGGLIADNGTLFVQASTRGGGGTVLARNGGMVVLAGGTFLSPATIQFGTGGASIDILVLGAFNGTLRDFVQNDTLILPDVSVTGASLVASALNIVTTGTTYKIPFATTYPGTPSFAVTNAGGTAAITVTSVCYGRGTRILTSRGEVAVEDLRPGDNVVTLHRVGLAPIRWIGRQPVDLSRRPFPARVRPVRVSRDVFGPGLPHRDLILSPKHALLLDGVLVPVRHLVDDAAIRWNARRVVEYFHIESERHDIVLAKGLPAEAWRDTGNRAMFDNDPSVVSIFADFTPDTSSAAWHQHACAPRLTGGAGVDAIRRRVLIASTTAALPASHPAK